MLRASVVATMIAGAVAGNLHDREFYEVKFFEWLKEHKVTPTDGAHFVHMLQNFASNDDFITTTNAQNLPYKLGHNKFSHLSKDEWSKYVRLGLAKPTSNASKIHSAPANYKSDGNLDWREKGAVTPVKDQGQCGSCWSFSTTGAIEGAQFLKGGSLISYSEQNFVDCDTHKNGGTDLGCNGGLMDSAFSWATKNGGVCTEADYPYTSGTTKKAGECNTSCNVDARSAPLSYTDVQTNSDIAMMSALDQQPVAIAIEADQAAFQLYKSGVLTATCGTSLDHGVLAVGYGNDATSGYDYYLVKNSWGPDWGDAGYIKLQRGSGVQKQGQCGMLSGPPSFPNM